MINLNSRKPLKRALLMAPVAIALSGCLSLLPQAQNAPNIYKLTTPTQVAQKLENAPVVSVLRPNVIKALSTDDIVLSPDGNRIAYAAASRWAEPVPNLIQQAAIDSMVQKSAYSTISSGSLARPEYVLQINLRAFEAVFDNGEDAAPMSRVQMTATLTQSKSRELIGETQIYSSERASERRVGSIVNAQRSATVKAMSDLANWVETQVGPPS